MVHSSKPGVREAEARGSWKLIVCSVSKSMSSRFNDRLWWNGMHLRNKTPDTHPFIHVLPPFSRHLAIYSAECLIPESESQQVCSTAGVTGAESGFWSYLAYIHEHISAKEASVQQSFKVSTLWIKQTHLHENNGWWINQPFSNAMVS